jgi:GNAT superfamily N-acetyltransferase
LIIEPLSKLHNRKAFDSGDPEVNRFLHEQALQDHDKDMSRTMVLVDAAHPSRILGYHTLAIQYVRQEDIPGDKPRIKRPIPVILLGQLGVDASFQGKRYGELLLMDAQARTDEVSRRTGVRSLMLDARTERLAKWYEKHDFSRFPGQLRMFKSIAAIRRLALYTPER